MLKTLILVTTATVALALSAKVSYKNYKVFRVTCESPDQLRKIKHLDDINTGVSLTFLLGNVLLSIKKFLHLKCIFLFNFFMIWLKKFLNEILSKKLFLKITVFKRCF